MPSCPGIARAYVIQFTIGEKVLEGVFWRIRAGGQQKGYASAPRAGVAAMGAPSRLRSGAHRLVAGRGRSVCVRTLGAGKGLLQAVDGLGQSGYLLRQALGI